AEDEPRIALPVDFEKAAEIDHVFRQRLERSIRSPSPNWPDERCFLPCLGRWRAFSLLHVRAEPPRPRRKRSAPASPPTRGVARETRRMKAIARRRHGRIGEEASDYRQRRGVRAWSRGGERRSGCRSRSGARERL